jgi:hypothetical protein
MEQETKKRGERRPSIFWPVLLIVIGIFMLLNTLNLLSGSLLDTMISLWPLLLIVGGLDGIYRGSGYLGSVIWIGIGAVFLMGNFGYIQTDAWRMMLKLWPILIIAFGFDLILGRKSLVNGIVAGVVGAAMIGGLVWVVVNGPTQFTFGQPARVETISEELGGASEGDIRISKNAGELFIEDGTSESAFVEAELELFNNEIADTSYEIEDGIAELRVESRGSSYSNTTGIDGDWEFYFNKSIPLELQSTLIAGEHRLDLGNLNISYIDAETIFGEMVVTLPSSDINGRLNVVIGELILRVPEDANVRIKVDNGITSTSYPNGMTRDDNLIYSTVVSEGAPEIDLSVEVPIGALTIQYVR